MCDVYKCDGYQGRMRLSLSFVVGESRGGKEGLGIWSLEIGKASRARDFETLNLDFNLTSFSNLNQLSFDHTKTEIERIDLDIEPDICCLQIYLGNGYACRSSITSAQGLQTHFFLLNVRFFSSTLSFFSKLS